MVVHLCGHRSVFLVPWLDAPERIDAIRASAKTWDQRGPSTARVVPVGDGRQEFGEFIPCGGRPPLGGLRGKPSHARIDGVAVIERIGSSEARPYVVAWGTLTEEDEDRLRTSVAAPPDVDVTVDLCEVEEVTEDGCDAIKNVAEDMGGLGQTMVVLYQPDRVATRSLERTGLLEDGRIIFVASSPARRIDVDAL
jgi:hypothetical protein